MANFTKLPGGAIGCNVEQMTSLSGDFRNAIEQVETVLKGLDGKVGSTTWSGADATQCEGRWNTTRNQTMNNLRTMLEEMSTAIKNQANQQTQASA